MKSYDEEIEKPFIPKQKEAEIFWNNRGIPIDHPPESRLVEWDIENDLGQSLAYQYFANFSQEYWQ